MAIFLITGKPGAGKTYFQVKHLLDDYYKYDSNKDEYVKKFNFVLISNIPNLSLDHVSLDEAMVTKCRAMAKLEALKLGSDDEDVINELYDGFWAERVRHFFNYNHQKRLSEKADNIIYAISESQKIFGSSLGKQKWKDEVFNMFQEHRHLGLSFYMDTQSRKLIHSDLYALVEKETNARPRTMSILGEFKYHEFVDGQKITSMPKAVKPDKKVFECYRGFIKEEVEKPKKAMTKLLVILIGGFLFSYSIYTFGLKKNLGASTAYASETPAFNIEKEREKIKKELIIEMNNKEAKKMYWVKVNSVRYKFKTEIVDPRKKVVSLDDARNLDRDITMINNSVYLALNKTEIDNINERNLAIETGDFLEVLPFSSAKPYNQLSRFSYQEFLTKNYK